MSFRIRPAGERDLVKILRIEKECFTDPWSINVFRGAMSEPHTSVFVLVDDSEEVAGYSVSDVVLENVLEDARNKGVKRFFLEVRKSNEKALKLYEKAGFTRLSVRKAYYQDPVEDAIVMELRC